jgi:hypothetical protein
VKSCDLLLCSQSRKEFNHFHARLTRLVVKSERERFEERRIRRVEGVAGRLEQEKDMSAGAARSFVPKRHRSASPNFVAYTNGNPCTMLTMPQKNASAAVRASLERLIAPVTYLGWLPAAMSAASSVRIDLQKASTTFKGNSMAWIIPFVPCMTYSISSHYARQFVRRNRPPLPGHPTALSFLER